MAANAQFAEDLTLRARTLRLILGRVAFLLLLLTANLWRSTGTSDTNFSDNIDGLALAFATVAGLSVIYYAALNFAPRVIDQVRIQFVVDVLLITVLVWGTGDIVSPYITLYIVVISVSGFFLGRAETLYISIGCAVIFTLLSALISQDLVYSGSGEQPMSRVLQIVGVNNVAILLVGLLAARLSERRKLSEDLKYAEEMFDNLNLLHERIVDSIGNGLVTTDLSGRIYAFNRSAEEITGITAKEAIGKNVFDIFGHEMHDKVAAALDPHHTGPFEPVNFESRLERGASISPVTLACSVVPLTGRSGQTNGLILTFRDVSEIKSLEEEVRRSDRLAAVGRMAAGLAHEIRNPLGSMSSALQFLQQRSDAPASDARLMNVVLRESERMNSIITNFLAFARPSSNAIKEEIAEVDITVALEDCMSLIRHSPDVTPEHRFEFDVDSAVVIEGDATQIKQVFWNLAQNALRSMPDGGTLSVTLKKTPAQSAMIKFRDTGVGMSEEIRSHAFEPFVSGSGGTGLGLSIVYKIVTDHGGTINITPESAGGTSVVIELPQKR